MDHDQVGDGVVPVHVWPHRSVTGWDGAAVTELEWFPATPLVHALLTRHATDAHMCMYQIPGETQIPRLRKTAVRGLPVEPVMQVAMLDLDCAEHTPWSEGGTIPTIPGNTPAEALAFLRSLCPQAGLYSTRAGVRLVWVLDRPVPISQGDALLRWLVSTLPGADALTDWTRCFRLPYVIRDGVPTDPVVDLDPLLMGATLATPPLGTLRRETLTAPLPMLPDDAPEAPGTIPAHLWESISPNTQVGQVLDALRAGRPIAEPGERNTRLFKVIRSLAHQLSHTAEGVRRLTRSNEAFQRWLAETLYAGVAASVQADTTDGAPTLADAWGMISRTAALEAGKWVQRQPALATPPEPEPQVADFDPDDDDWRPDPANPILVKVESAYFVQHHLTGDWSFPVDASGLPAILRDYQPRVVLGRTVWSTLAAHTLTRLYGIVGEGVVYDMAADTTRWDQPTRTMRIACCHMADIRPQRHPEIEEWLIALAGEHEDRLLDWLATADRLTSPTSALYLEGPRGIGKGMLAAALARMYNGTPVDFMTAIDKFNMELRDCPIVWIDESVEASRRVSGAFRSLITEGHRKIEQKYMPSAKLEGCVRLVICANNPEAIKLTGRHTKDDVEAIKQRIFHLTASGDAARYLARLGGREYTEAEAWVAAEDGVPGKLCEHLRWLQMTRQVERGDRLLVEGPSSEYHRRLLASSGLAPQVLWVIAEALLHNQGAKQGSRRVAVPGIEVREDMVWVNVSSMHDKWKMLISEDVQKPERADVLSAVRSMSAFKASRKLRCSFPGGSLPLQCWGIDPALVWQIADDYGLAEMDALRQILDGEPPRGPAKVVQLNA